MSAQLLFRDDAYLTHCEARVVAVSERGIECDRTVFYPMGGGQPGDVGVLTRADGSTLRIVDTRKGDAVDSVLHLAEADKPLPQSGETVHLGLDWERRYAHMCIHTVKTMSVQPPRGHCRVRLLRIPGIDLQPCGGTHVRNIDEIGPMRVLRIRNEGRRNRRVEIGFA